MSRQQLQTIVQMLRSQPVVKPDATVQEARAGFEQIASTFPVDADIKREAVDAGSVKSARPKRCSTTPPAWPSVPGRPGWR